LDVGVNGFSIGRNISCAVVASSATTNVFAEAGKVWSALMWLKPAQKYILSALDSQDNEP